MVDDSETLRQQVRMALAPKGFDIVEATDGQDGLNQIRGGHDIALVLCDVNMPNMSGLDLLTRMREEGLSTPVIMLTTEGQPSLVRQARDLGAKGWIVKPFKTDLLVAAVKRLTPQATGERGAA